MSNYYDFLAYLKEHIQTKLGSFPVSAENVVIRETKTGMVTKPDTYFPRVEMPYLKVNKVEPLEQHSRLKVFSFGIAGYSKRVTAEETDEDLAVISDLASAVENAVFDLNYNKEINGISPCEGFLMVLPETELHIVHEHEPKIDSFLLLAHALVGSSNNKN